MAAPKNNNYASLRRTNKTWTQEEIDTIIQELLDWAQYSDGIHIATFIYEKFKRSKNWLYSLAVAHKDLYDAIETAKSLISGKIKNHSFKGDRNATFGEKILPMYSKDYKDLLKWKADIQKEMTKEPENQSAFNEWKESQKIDLKELEEFRKWKESKKQSD